MDRGGGRGRGGPMRGGSVTITFHLPKLTVSASFGCRKLLPKIMLSLQWSWAWQVKAILDPLLVSVSVQCRGSSIRDYQESTKHLNFFLILVFFCIKMHLKWIWLHLQSVSCPYNV
jgi:hypothetical protein